LTSARILRAPKDFEMLSRLSTIKRSSYQPPTMEQILFAAGGGSL
jgi:hypothetical protein